MAADATRTRILAGPPPAADSALRTLPEAVAGWFQARFSEPTPAQRYSWPTVAASEHFLLSAPTGSGKTLAAFLPILGELFRQPFSSGVRCLYVAPLKALTHDVRKNLRAYLRGIRACLAQSAGSVRIALRTGDTPARARRLFRVQPPDILLTTPESLAVVLSQPALSHLFATLRWVVVDEVHALAENKRGADLALSLERLTSLAGEGLQRIGLSATCAPLHVAARFLAGTGRPCAVASVDDPSPLELEVEPLPLDEGGFLARLLDRLEPELVRHRSTLVFTNTRALAERLVWSLRRRHPDAAEQFAAHHSSLAPLRRRVVERRLKQGRLRAVVSSTSLELGIDIGSVDRVVLVHPPGGVVRLLQRVGRSGHAPGRVRSGLILTASPAELLEATVTVASGRSGECEPLRLPRHPLDVLCQQLLGLAAQRRWTPDEAFELARRAAPFAELSRDDFQACLDYLSGRHADGRTWLPARVRWIADEFTIVDRRTAVILRRNIGTILAEEPCSVRIRREGASSPLGDVEEAFSDRLRPGDRFLLDGRCVEYRGREGEALVVDEVFGRPAVPQWGGEGWPLAPELARRLFAFRHQAAESLRDGRDRLVELLRRDYGLEHAAVAELVAFFERQECLSEVPGSTTTLIEAVPQEWGADYYLHTPLNRAGNDAVARVVVARLTRRGARAVTSVVADLGLALQVRGARPLAVSDFQELLSAAGFEQELTAALADSVTLREQFRRVALTGLMILRNPLGGRRRVGGEAWAERRLYEQVRAAAPGFVLLRQAEREVREGSCDAGSAGQFLAKMPRWALRLRWLPRPSPFAEAWTQLAAGPAETVETPAEALRRLHARLTTSA